MKAILPGRFAAFDSMKPGELFAFNRDDVWNLAMKVHYAPNKTDKLVRFFEPGDEKGAAVLVSSSDSVTRDHTLFVMDGLEVAPTHLYEFVGPLELDEKPVGSGWLGFGPNGGGVFLTCGLQDPGSRKIAAINLVSGDLIDNVPTAVWYRRWRIYRSTPSGSETIFEMELQAMRPKAQTTQPLQVEGVSDYNPHSSART